MATKKVPRMVLASVCTIIINISEHSFSFLEEVSQLLTMGTFPGTRPEDVNNTQY